MNLRSCEVKGKYIESSAPGAAMLNLGSKTLMPETTLYSPGSVKLMWLSYCPALSLLSEFNRTR